MCVEGSDLGEVRRKVGGEDLEQAVRVRQILEPMLAEIAQAHPVWQVSYDETLSGIRHENLTSVRGRADSGGPVDVHPDISTLRNAGFAGA
jgi:hypothetical protein